MKKKIALALLLSVVSTNITLAGSNFNYEQAQPIQPSYGTYQPTAQYPQNNTLNGYVVMVPAGTAVKTVITSPISSEYTTPGQSVSFALNQDFYYDSKLIAPAGSMVLGTVIESSKAKRGSINGKLCIRFTQINTPYGTQIPISAIIKTDDNSGVLVGGTVMDTTKEYVKDATIGVAAGAVSGVVFGALAGGSVGRAAALGTAVGAGGGLVKSIWDKGADVELPANATIDLVLTQPITTGVHY